MAFKKIKPKVKARLRAPVNFGFLSNGGRVVGVVTLNQSVLDKLDWKVGDTVDAALGEGEDEGLMLLSLSEAGPYRLTTPGGRRDHTKVQAAKINIGGFSAEENHASQPVQFDIMEDLDDKELNCIVITLPDFAQSAIKKGRKSLI